MTCREGTIGILFILTIQMTVLKMLLVVEWVMMFLCSMGELVLDR